MRKTLSFVSRFFIVLDSLAACKYAQPYIYFKKFVIFATDFFLYIITTSSLTYK